MLIKIKKMNKLLLFVSVILSTTLFAKKVKFAVDMTGQTISAFGIHVAGDFQILAGYPADWDYGGTLLTQEGSTNIYSVIVNIPAFRKYEFKFVNGDQGYETEYVPDEVRVGYDFNDNRWMYVDSLSNDTTFLGAIQFGLTSPANKYTIRYKVDMSNVTINPNGVHASTNYNSFSTTKNTMFTFTTNPSSDIFEVINYVDAGTYNFNYINGNTVTDKESSVPNSCSSLGVRNVTITKDSVFPDVCFNYCVSCALTSLSEKNQTINDFKVYPNPAKNTLNITSSKSSISAINIYNLTGQSVLSFNELSAPNFTINNIILSSGIYIVKVTSDALDLQNIKLIIE